MIKAGAATEVELMSASTASRMPCATPRLPSRRASSPAAASPCCRQSRLRSEKLDLEGEEAVGANIVKVAVEAPLKQIAVNAGLEGGVVAEKVRHLEPGFGLNAANR